MYGTWMVMFRARTRSGFDLSSHLAIADSGVVIDHTLDRWEAAASAMEESVRGTTATVSAQIETQKQMAAAATDKLKDAVETAQHVPAEMRQQIAANLDHLKVQLALGKADASDAAAAQQKEIEDAVKRVESQIDQMGPSGPEPSSSFAINWSWLRCASNMRRNLNTRSFRPSSRKCSVT